MVAAGEAFAATFYQEPNAEMADMIMAPWRRHYAAARAAVSQKPETRPI